MSQSSLPESLLQYAAHIIATEAGVTDIPADSVTALLIDAIAFHLAVHMDDPSNKEHRAKIYNEIHTRLASKLDGFVAAIKSGA